MDEAAGSETMVLKATVGAAASLTRTPLAMSR
jgi:hypothetical protein